MIGVVIADDHEIVRRGLRQTIQAEDDMRLLGEARTGREALDVVTDQVPDVVLLDVQMPDMDGIAAAAAIHTAHPQVVILMLSSFSSDIQLHGALRAGASGYLLKDISGDDLLAAIRGAARGEPQMHPDLLRLLMQQMPPPADPLAGLTGRERNILRLIARGHSNKEIGKELSLAEVTVKGYVSTILGKLGVSDRTQAALLAVRYNLVSPTDLPDLPRE